MRLTTVILLASLLQVSAATFGQRINLNQRSQPIESILREIRLQSGYSFLYNEKVLPENKTVSVSLSNASIDQAMNSVLSGLDLSYEIEGKIVTIKAKEPSFLVKLKEALGIPIVVSGLVTDSTGLALPGASIKIKDKVIRTDENGGFRISAEAGEEVTISFVGYKPYSFKVSQDMGFQNIVLRSAAGQLQEVIVNTGYQKISKERATGSFDFIDNEKFNEQVSTNVLDRLEGIASGLKIDKRQANSGLGATGITIRGISTINGQTEPLIVVDNFPYDGDINNINPNNVESITILKDAAASSIWGARAGNGVIVITTKQGKFGQKMKVTTNANVSIIEKPDLFTAKTISSGDFIDFEKLLFSKGYYNSAEQNTNSQPALSPVVELLIKARDHAITQEAADAQITEMKQYDIRNDLNKYVYRQGVNQQYAVNVNGGTNAIAYNLAAGYDKNIDNLSAGGQRINLTSANTFKPTKNLEITAGIYFTQSNTTNGKPGYGNISGSGYSQVPVYTRLVDDKGNAKPVYRIRQPYLDTLGHGQLLDWKYYPLDDYKHSTREVDPLDFTLNTSLAYKLLPFLKVSFNYQYEKQKTSTTDISDMQSYDTRDLINHFTQLHSDGSAPVYPVPKGSMETLGESNLTSNQIRGQLDFNKSWGKHSITALAGGEVRSKISSYTQSRLFGFDPNTYTSLPVDYVNFYPDIIAPFATKQIPGAMDVGKNTSRFVSAYANAAYTYADKYTLSGSMRKDGANIFGTTTNNKWKPLWSAGVSWNLSQEAFYHFSVLPDLKIRATYGYSGNLGDPSLVGVSTIRYYGSSYTSYFGTPQSAFASYDNPDLRWEKVGQTNIGVDFATRKRSISGSIEYYHKKTSDLIGPSAMDYTGVPVSYLSKNVASTAGNGVDIQLLTRNMNRKIKWTTTWNLSWNTDRVISYYAGDTTAGGQFNGLSRGGNNAVRGIYSYQWAGLDPKTGNPQGYLNGQVSTDYYSMSQASFRSLIYNGPAAPTFFGSIGNTVQWNNLSLTVNLLYKAGYYFRRPSINYTSLPSDGNGSADYAKRWQQPGDELHTNVPSLVYPLNGNRDTFYKNSSVLVDKGDNIRLNYVRLNYAMPQQWLNRIGMSTFNFYINASNLGVIWKANKDGIDPDYQYNYQSLKPSRVLSIGLTTSF